MMNERPRLNSLATVTPKHKLVQSEVAKAAADLFSKEFNDFDRLLPVYTNAQIDTRSSCVPLDWYLEPHTFSERNDLYIKNALDLIEEAANVCFEVAGLQPSDIGGLVIVSSTGMATPSLDALLMERMQLRRDIRRLPIFGLGCVGGVLGLARAAAMAKSEPGMRVLFLVVELCGLTFQKGDLSKSNVIASALFGDGAAGAIISCHDTGPEITGWGEHTWPHSLDVMGWNVSDDGFKVLFSRDIPNLIKREMKSVVAQFLRDQNMCKDNIDNYVTHPGGAKVLDALEEVFDLLPGALVHARDVLRRYGNMSAATVLFVLEQALSNQSGKFLISSLGPGFTAGFMTLRT
jgi:alkylresorcinol/alkylpyrone synthase